MSPHLRHMPCSHHVQPENAHYLERARKEADAFHKKHRHEVPSREALQCELPFLHACLKESGRLYPSTAGQLRLLEKEVQVQIPEDRLGGFEDGPPEWFGELSLAGAGGLSKPPALPTNGKDESKQGLGKQQRSA